MKKEVTDYKYYCNICNTELGKGCGIGVVVHEDTGAEAMTEGTDIEGCDFHLCIDCVVSLRNIKIKP